MVDRPTSRLPDAAAMPYGERDSDLLRTEIDALFPALWKTDSSPQLAALLNVIARAKTMGRPGFDMLKDFAERLRRNRAFDDLYVLTSEMNSDGLDTPRTQHLEIQALIELGVFETALDLVRPLLAGSVTDPDADKAKNVREAYGLVGRIYKQMFVDARRPERRTELETQRLFLQRSFNAYMKVWSELQSTETAYHGVNALAVARMAQGANLTETDDSTEVTALAQTIIAVINASRDADIWTEASRGEALIALGRYGEAAQAYAAFADHPHVEAFALGSSLRQLEEIWGLKGEDAEAGKPVRILKTALLAKVDSIAASNKEAGKAPAALQAERVKMTPREIKLADNDLASMPMPAPGVTGASPEALQKTYGINSPIGRKAIRRKLQLSSAVCRVCGPRNGEMQGMATGFAIRGDLLHESFGPGPVIVTNNHVISTRGTMGARRPDLCTAIFMSETEEEDPPTKFERVLWESDIDAHDVTILKPKGDLPAGVVPLSELMAGSLGPRAQDDNGIGRCYVIGFPLAKELSFSLADNILLDHNAPSDCAISSLDGKRVCKGVPPNPVRVHYRTPTMEGNSGSPVFDADTITLLGVHHAGARDMKRLNGKAGTYAANEGIWIDSIREAIATSLANGAMEADGVAPHWGMAAATPDPVDPGDLVVPASVAKSMIVPGFAGDPIPGLSAYASELIYAPGKAKDEDRRAAQLETVIGVDNRTRLLDTQMAPWRMICAIRARWGSRLMVGTGCFIGPDTILTAGHVTYAREFQKRAQQIEVIPGLSVERGGGEKRPYGSAFAREVHVHENWKNGFSPRFDVSVIKLDRPLGQQVGWFGLGARPREDLLLNWAHVTGYPGEMKEERPEGATADQPPIQAAQLWHHAAPIEEINNGRLFYKTDTTPGQSGAPVYVLSEAGQYGAPQVVGVHAYGARSTPGAIGLANSGVWIDADMLTKILAWSGK
ncbi:MAG: trypsin-like peptidase domain-containing protein [Hyphomonadaceae bacterium]